MMIFTIEKLESDKICILQKIARQSFFETFSKVNSKSDMDDYLTNNLSLERLTKEFADPQSLFYMARINQQYVGYIKLNFGNAQNEFQSDNAMEIERLYVLQQYHGQKVGQALYEYAISVARQKKLDYVWLGVWEHNQKAISFYQKHGFVSFGQHEFKLGTDIQIDILMSKRINN